MKNLASFITLKITKENILESKNCPYNEGQWRFNVVLDPIDFHSMDKKIKHSLKYLKVWNDMKVSKQNLYFWVKYVVLFYSPAGKSKCLEK